MSNFTCEALNRSPISNEGAVFFQEQSNAESLHSRMPRFGHTSNITVVIAGSKDDSKDYVVGLVAAAIAVFAFFVAWCIVLIVFKCLGYKRVGFFSGHGVKLPRTPPLSEVENGSETHDTFSGDLALAVDPYETEPASTQQAETNKNEVDSSPTTGPYNDDEQGTSEAENQDEGFSPPEHEDAGVLNVSVDGPVDGSLAAWQAQVKRRQLRLRRIRITALVAGCIILVATILVIVMGVSSLTASLDDARSGLLQGSDLAIQAANITSKFAEVERNAISVYEAFEAQVEDLGSVCPNLCTNSSKEECLDVLPSGEELNSVLNFVSEFKDGVLKDVSDFGDDLRDIAETIDSAEEKSANFYWAFVIAAVFAGLLGLMDIVMMIGIVLAWNKKLKGNCLQKCLSCVRNWFFVPIFVVLVVLCFIFSMVFIIGSTVTADMCVDSPDPKLQGWLDDNAEDFHPIFYELASFYLQGCPEDRPLATLQNNTDIVRNAASDLLIILDAVAGGASQAFQDTCGGDVSPLSTIAEGLGILVCLLSEIILDILDFFACQNWQPLYATIMYGAVCYNGTSGFIWIASMQLLIMLCAMVMLTLRASFYEIGDEEDETTRRACLARYCGCCVRSPHVNDEANIYPERRSDAGDDLKGTSYEAKGLNSGNDEEGVFAESNPPSSGEVAADGPQPVYATTE